MTYYQIKMTQILQTNEIKIIIKGKNRIKHDDIIKHDVINYKFKV